MANKTISDLLEKTTVADSDIIWVQNASTDNKVTKANLLKEVNDNLNLKANTTHTHTKSQITDFPLTVDNLTSTSSSSNLSANQGKILDDKITTLNTQAVKSKDYAGGIDLSVNPNVLNRLDSVENLTEVHSTQLAEKANEVDVKTNLDKLDLLKADKTQIGSPLTATNIAGMTDKTKVYVNTTDGNWYSWNGTEWIIGGVYNSQGIGDKTITPVKTSFFEYSKNLYNKLTAKSGYFVSQTDGKEYASAAYGCSDFIKIDYLPYIFTSNATYGGHRYALYNDSKTFVIGALGNKIPATEGVSYAKISFPINDVNKIQLEEGEVETSYVDFCEKIPLNFIKMEDYNPPTVTKKPILNLPSKLYVVVGEELNIYFDNIIEGKDTDYSFDVVCNKGTQLGHVWRFVPDVVEIRPLTLNVYKDNVLVATKSTIIKVSNKTVGSGVNKKVILLGDSTVNSQAADENNVSVNGMVSRKIIEDFSTDSMKVTMIGTKGTSPYWHEGRSGWSAKLYMETQEGNAFYNPTTKTFDFNYYMVNSGVVTPDYFIINLGINDTFPYATDEELNVEIANIINRFNVMIASVKSYSANIKIGMALTIPPNYSQDAFGKIYSSQQNRDRYKRNNILWVKKLIETYENREPENIYLIPIHTNLDTRYNMGLEDTQVNARNSLTYPSPIANGGVHPVMSGYWQIADIYYYWLKSFES